MINEELSKTATAHDAVLLKAAHPVGAKILTYIGGKWRLKKVPFVGTIISDPAFIREVFMDNKRFSKEGKDTSTSFWNLIFGDSDSFEIDGAAQRNFQKVISSRFTQEKVEKLFTRVSAPILEETADRLSDGEQIDMVEVAERIAYLSMWHLVGLSDDKLSNIDFNLAVKTFRSITEGLNPIRTKVTKNQINVAKGRLTLLDELAREAYNTDDKDSVPLLLKKEGFSEEVAISLTKFLFVAGTETIINFIPRMTALFIKSRYIDYLSSHPEHVTRGVEEALRVTALIPVEARTVVQKTEFHGIQLQTGDRLLLSTVGASKKFGYFNPFNEVNKDLQGLWFETDYNMSIAVSLAISQAEIIGRFLATANTSRKLEIGSQSSDDKGHTGSYKELTIFM